MTSKHRLYHLLQLCQFSDSALPIGSFAFSNGLESAIQLGMVHDDKTLEEFIRVSLKQSAHMDGIYVNHAFDLAAANDIDGLISLDLNYIAKRVGKEQQLMTSRIGSKLATLFLNIQESKILSNFLAEAKDKKIMAAHPIVHGIIFKQLNLSKSEAFAIYQYGTASMILSSAIRLMKIDHYQTQRILFETNKTVDEYFNQVVNSSIDDTFSFAPVYDCLISQHVSAHVRMFMN